MPAMRVAIARGALMRTNSVRSIFLPAATLATSAWPSGVPSVSSTFTTSPAWMSPFRNSCASETVG